jgi:hypothetical protein
MQLLPQCLFACAHKQSPAQLCSNRAAGHSTAALVSCREAWSAEPAMLRRFVVCCRMVNNIKKNDFNSGDFTGMLQLVWGSVTSQLLRHK